MNFLSLRSIYMTLDGSPLKLVLSAPSPIVSSPHIPTARILNTQCCDGISLSLICVYLIKSIMFSSYILYSLL